VSTTRNGNDKWLVTHRTRTDPRASLICFPSAGAGASAYTSWRRFLPGDVDLLAVQLPGRDSRLGEDPLASCAEVAEQLTPRIAGYPARRLVLYGHSLGALLAFEVARRLRDRLAPGAGPELALLVVSGSRAPHLPSRLAWADGMADDALVTELQRLGCDPTGALNDPEVARLFLPALRADLVMAEQYRYGGPGRPLEVPILALSGKADLICSPAEAEAWVEHTTAGFVHRLFPGGHFFIREHEDDVTATIFSEIHARTVGVDA